jgi:hypothetical protein
LHESPCFEQYLPTFGDSAGQPRSLLGLGCGFDGAVVVVVVVVESGVVVVVVVVVDSGAGA